MATRKSKTTRSGVDSFGFDPKEAVRYLSSVDAILGSLIKRAGPFDMQVRSMHSPSESLARNIIYQQLHGTAAAAIHERVIALFGEKKLHPQDILDASDESLRGTGLSGAKLAALKDLVAKTFDGTVPTLARLRRMGDKEIIAPLTRIVACPTVLSAGHGVVYDSRH
jgi:DNA-3-methyladenine glycosylase II